ncbi:hypothetical protein IGI04_023526 [Brassica rapa subsp. trilocularis]|uniref:Uncharacterized protein n=1 Tax=Brassica rapa subsp. trilocularis TaxID=1813537 RepID=A0ABQ7M455_BRACM|nr:hypothetical protein IGI04_023526 [Brassica rapa subsp. trilocularis]
MFWDSGCFNAGKCRVLLHGELALPCSPCFGDARGSWRTRPVFLSSFLIQSQIFVVEWSQILLVPLRLGVLSLRRLFQSRLLHLQLWLLVVWVFSRECWRGSVGKASFSWWLGELFSLIVEHLSIQGAWTEQRFPLSSFEVPGCWSYRLAGEAAAISVVWVQNWRVPGGGL